MKIHVSQEDIDSAIRNHSGKCMIDIAVARQKKNCITFKTDVQLIRYSNPIDRLRYFHVTPPLAVARLIDFDDGKKIKPFTFELPPPDYTQPMHPWAESRPRTAPAADPKATPGIPRTQQRTYGHRAMVINQRDH